MGLLQNTPMKNHISQALLGMVDVVFALELNYDEKL